MKKIIQLLNFLIFTFFTVNAQQSKYITYIVKEGESVRDLAKRYDVKSKEILQLNPGLKKKPKVDTFILIPNVNFHENTPRVEPAQIHITQPKETVWGISKQYNVSIKALDSLNPELLIKGLKIGMVLQIPNDKMLTPEELRQNELDFWVGNYVMHTVVKDDTMYSLTRFYNVSSDSLLMLNPQLVDGLKLESIIKIKKKIPEKELLALKEMTFVDSIIYKEPINVTMLLPFKFSKNDTLTKEQLFTTKNNLVSIITDFYLGANIALDSLRNQDIAVDLDVYDSDNNAQKIDSLVQLGVFKDTDVVFGPVFNKHVDKLASQLEDVPVVFPFYSIKQKSFEGRNVIKTTTSRKILKENVLSYFSQQYAGAHVLVVGDEKKSSKDEFSEIGAFLKESNDSIKEISFLQPENGYISNERFFAAVDTLGVNWVVLTTNNKVVTADVMNNLKSIPNEAQVRLFAFEKATNFDKVDNNLLADMDFVYASSGVTVDTLQNISNFYSQYLTKNKAYPSEYAVRGFDLVYDILLRMVSNNSLSLSESFGKGVSKRVRSTFSYEQKEYGGPAYNTAVYLRNYEEDLSISVVELKKDEEVLEEEIIQDSDEVKDVDFNVILDAENNDKPTLTKVDNFEDVTSEGEKETEESIETDLGK